MESFLIFEVVKFVVTMVRLKIEKKITKYNNNNWYTDFEDIPFILSGMPSRKFLEKSTNIAFIINLSTKTTYKTKIPTFNFPCENTLDMMSYQDEILSLLDHAIKKNMINKTDKKILIHCDTGNFYSCYYLSVWLFNHFSKLDKHVTFDECVAYVKLNRKQIKRKEI